MFEVPMDLAGGTIQCPQCHVLADIPSLSDLPNLNPDGTFAFEDPEALPDPFTAGDLHKALTNRTTDSHGREKDLRMKVEHLQTVGVEEGPIRVVPRYDPETGELIRPLPLKDEAPIPVLAIATEVDEDSVDHLDQAAVPMPVIPLPDPGPSKSLGYAVGLTRKVVTMGTIGIELFMPANLAVMFFAYICYVLGYFATLGMATYTERFLVKVQPFLLLNIPMWLLLSHLGCVLEEIGPDAVDELPRPLRYFSFGDDIWNPAFRCTMAIVLCFAPLCVGHALLNPLNPMTMPINLSLGLLGAFFFPAIVLTTVTGTTILNLRPDRVAAVIRLAGMQYFASVMLFALAAIPSVYYLGNELLFPQKLTAPLFGILERPGVMLLMLALTVYFLHLFAWHLGLIYRNGHDDYPWLAQRHIRTPRP
jgi:hypothetical protein